MTMPFSLRKRYSLALFTGLFAVGNLLMGGGTTPYNANPNSYSVLQNVQTDITYVNLLSNDDGTGLNVVSTNRTATVGATSIATNAPGPRVVYDPRSVTSFIALDTGDSVSDTFTYTIAGDGGLASGGSATATVTVTVNGVNDPVTLTSLTLTQTVNDNATITPFTGATITDPDTGETITVTVVIDAATEGTFTAASSTALTPIAFTNSVSGTYVFSGTRAQAQAALRGLVFNPSENFIRPDSPNNTFGVDLKVTVSDGTVTTPQATVGVTVTSINDTPTLTVGDTTLAMTDKEELDVFSDGAGEGDFELDDDDVSDQYRLIVTYDSTKGDFTSTTGFTAAGTSTATTLTRTGTLGALQTALDGLTYDPIENLVEPGDTQAHTISVSFNDDVGETPTRTAVTGSTTITVTSVNDAPDLSPAGPFPLVSTASGATYAAFDRIVVADPDYEELTDGGTGVGGGGGANFTATITLTDNADSSTGDLGAIASSSFNETSSGSNVYTYEGKKAAVQDAIRAALYVAPSATGTFKIKLQVRDASGEAATQDSNIVVATTAVVQPTPGMSNLDQGQSVDDDSTIDPFRDAIFNSFGTGSRKVELTLVTSSGDLTPDNNDEKGVFDILGSFTKDSSGDPHVYSFTGNAINATSAINALRFSPTENLIVGASDTITFRVQVKDISSGSELSVDYLTITVNTINDFPSINLLGFNADYRIDDNETTNPYDQVDVADVDEAGAQEVTAVVTFVGEEPGAPGTLYISDVLQAVPYTITGTPTEVTAALKLLEFRPDPIRNAVGENENVTFTLTVTDEVGASVTNTSRIVTVDAVNGAPQINGVPALSEQPFPVPASGERTIVPFVGLTVLDEENLDFTITLDNDSKGVLSTAGAFTFTATSPVDPLNPDDGAYTMTGTPSAITAALRALVYTVDASYIFPEGGTGLTTFTLEASDANNTTTIDFTLYLRERNVAHIVSTTADSGTGSLREAIAFAKTGDFIVFELPVDEYPATIRLASTITIDTHLTIVGSGVDELTISGDTNGDGTGDVGIFSVVDGGSLALERLTLADGAAPSYGGAIAVDEGGSLSARDCSFEGNTAGQYGGAIDVFLGDLLIEQCLFYQNSINGSQAQGGGAISIYTTGTSIINNSTFVENSRTNTSEDFGGGAIFAENGDLAQFFYLDVEHCTFLDNTDAGNNGGAILAKNSGLEVRVRNNIFALSNIVGSPDDLPTLDVLNGGQFLSLGGNIVTDSTQTTFTQGGNQNVFLLDSSIDDLSVPYNSIGLLPLADNGGPTLTCGLSASSIAIDEALIVDPIADSLAVDQRGMWRDSTPDVGAFEADNYKRININELYVETTDATDFIEFYVPRDSAELSVNGLELWIDGVNVHTFAGEDSLPPAYALVYDDTVDLDGVELDGEKGLVELKRANGQLLNRVSYIGAFAESGVKLNIAGQSITRYPVYEGGFLPHLRAAQQYDPSSTLETSPGDDLNGTPFGGGNAVPIAVIDAAFDENAMDYNPIYFVDANLTLTPNVLENDIEYDLQDLLKITEIMPLSAGAVFNQELLDDTTSDGNFTLSELPTGVDTSVDPFDPAGTITDPDVRVTISGDGQVITYDPRLSDTMIALSAGETITDIWAYTIADFSGDPLEQNPRGSEDPVDDIDHIDNIKKATTYFTVVVTGVNNPPVAGDDLGAATEENQAIRFLVDDELLAPTVFNFGDLDANYGDFDSTGAPVVLKPELQTFSLLANDSDVDNDNDNDARDADPLDGIATLEVVSVHTTDVTVVGQLTTVSELNATVKLDLRANRIETSIVYDPRSSSILNALQAGEQVTDYFYYTIRDLHGEPAVAQVSVLITGVNDIPTANDDPDFMTTEDITLEITDSELLGNDTDPDQNDDPSMDDDVLTILSVPATSDSGAVLTLSLDKTEITYDPTGLDYYEDLARNEVIIDQFVYTISDGNDGVSEATAFIKLVGRNDRPTAQDDLLEIDENQTATVAAADGLIDNDDDIDINGTPPDDDPWVIPQRDIITGMGAAFYIETDGSYGYDANSAAIESLPEGQVVIETFPYILTDNSRMNASDDNFKLVWNSAEVTLPVLANDDVAGSVPVDVLGFTADSGNAARVIIESSNHELRDGQIIKIENYEGGATYNGVFPIAVIDRDHFSVEAPFVDTPATELGTWRPWFVITSFSDPDNNGIASISADQQSLSYFPRVNFYGTETFSYTIENGVGGQDVSVVEMLMIRAPLNSDLCANDDSVRMYKDQGMQTIDVLANDNTLPGLGSNLVITQVSVGSADGTIEIAPDNKSLTYTPADPSAVGVDTFTYTISGGVGSTSSAQATLTVTIVEPENFVINADDEDDYFVVVVGSAAQALDVLTNDETQPGYPVSLQLISVSTPTAGSATKDGNQILYTAPAAAGTDSFDYVVEDEFGLQTTKSVQIEVVADTSNFYAVRDEYIVWAGSPEVIFPVLNNDVATGTNSDNLSIENLGLDTQAPPAPERVAFTADGVNFTPPDTAGEEIFTYEIGDGTLERREAEIRVTIVDDYPELDVTDDTYCVAKNSSAQTLDVLGNDATFPLVGWQQLITSVGSPDQGGTAVINAASSILYTPAEGFFGEETFTYTVSDLYGQTDTATVTIRVGSLTTAPDAYVVLEDSVNNALPVLLNDDWLNRFAADYEISAVSAGNQSGTITIDGVGPNNQILYTPSADFFGVETFTYTVTDETGNTIDETVTVEVIAENSDRAFAELRIELTGVNDSPVLGGTEDDSITDKESSFPFDTVTLSDVDEGGDQEQTVTVEFDPSLGTITFSSAVPAFALQSPGVYQVVGTPAQVVAALRSIEFTPFENIRPPIYYDAVFTLTITDGYLVTPIVDLTTVTILAINDAPTGVDDAYSTEETQTIRLLADATLLLVPFDFGDIASNYKDFDANGVEQTYLPELQNVNLLINDDDVDVDDDNTTIEIVNVHPTATRVNQITATSALGASIVLDIRAVRAETSILYDPRGSATLNALAAGETIVDTFYYTVVDQHGAEDQALVSITVTGVNDIPTANGDGGFELNEDGTITLDGTLILSNDTDPDQDGNGPDDAPIILSVPPTSNAGATLTLTPGGDIIYNPDDMEEFESLARNEFLEDSFTYTISDEMGGTSQALIELLVEGINDAPVADDDALAILENDTQTRDRASGLISNDSDVDMGITFNTGDPNDDPWIIPQREQTSPLGAAFFIETDGSYSYDANSRAIDSLYEGEIAVETFPYVIIDNSRLSAAQDSFKVVTDSTQVVLPVLSNDDVAGSVPVAIEGFTEDLGDVQRVIIESFEHPLREGMLVKIEGYVGDGDYDGVYPISVIDRDHFSVAAPYVAGTNTSLGTWRPWFQVTAVTEADQDAVLEISEDGQSILYTPMAGYYGTEYFEYTIMDGVGGQDVAIVELTVLQAPLNTVLSASDDIFQVGKGESSVEVDVLANDNVLPALGSDFSITAVSVGSAGGTLLINGSDDAVIYSPIDTDFVGSETFTYDVSGGGSTSAQATVTFVVIDREGFLRSSPDAFFVIEDSSNNLLDVAANDTTLPSFPVSFEVDAVSTPSSGVALIVGGQVSYTPNASFTGTDTFTYTIRDASGSNVTETVTVEVVPDVNDFYARNDHYIIVAGSGNYNLDVLINDGTSGAVASDLIIEDLGLDTQAPPDINRVDHTDAVVTYTAPASATTEVFTYEILNGFGTDPRREGTITIVVVDSLPTPTNPLDDAYHVAKNSGPYTLDVLLNDIPMPTAGWSWTITSVGGTDQGGVAVNDGGTAITYTPNAGFYGVESFTYTIVDAFGDSASATVTVTVGSQLTEPDFYTVLENSTGNDFPVLVNDDILERFPADYTISQVGAPDQGGSVVIDGSGPDNQLLYAPAADFVGEESFTYTVIDNTGAEVTEDVTVLVIDEIGDRDFADFVVTLTGINDLTMIASAPDVSTTDKLSVSPFPTITISDLDEDDLQDQITVLTFDSSLGSISASAFSQIGPGTYTMTGTPAEVQAALRAIVFTPFENVIDYIDWAADNSIGDLDFTLSLDDLNLGPVLGDSADAAVVDVVTINIEPIDDTPTLVSSIADEFMQVNDLPRGILLTPHFADVDDDVPGGELIWTVSNNTNTSIFDSVIVDPVKQLLVITLAADQFGVADITVRGTDRGGLFVEETFTVTVDGPPVIELEVGQENPDSPSFVSGTQNGFSRDYRQSFVITNEGVLPAQAFILHVIGLDQPVEGILLLSAEYTTDDNGTLDFFNDDTRSSAGVEILQPSTYEYSVKYDQPLEPGESIIVHLTYRVASIDSVVIEPDIRVELTTATPLLAQGTPTIAILEPETGEVELNFVIEAGKTYVVQSTEFIEGPWNTWELDLPVSEFNRELKILDDGLYTENHPSLVSQRFYRLAEALVD